LRGAARNPYDHGPNPVSPAQAVTVTAILEAALRSHDEQGGHIAPELKEVERAAWAFHK
jgi:hypothetical protein